MWYSPEELVTIGFDSSSVLMANEGHNGLSRCAPTRVIERWMAEAHGIGTHSMTLPSGR